ncbi:MAG: MFS transporter [Mycobacteriales bacterium]
MALEYGEARGRWVLATAVLGSAMVFVDGTVVNVALPHIGSGLDASLSGLTWTVNGYALTLASLILLGGSLGDRFGRKRVFIVGVVWFAVASLLSGLAPDVETLIAARALQGVGGALLTPGSLALLQASFRATDRARAIGAWSGLAGIAGAAGPFLGGWLVEVTSWRWIFLVNLPLAVAVVAMAVRHVPESRDLGASHSVDVVGAVAGAVGLGALTEGLIAWQDTGLGSVRVLGPLVIGALASAAFLLHERRAAEPMLPLGIFASRVFSATNAVTFVVYAALGGVFFWLVLFLQVAAGFAPMSAGLALVPLTLLMLLLSPQAGALATRVGPRLPMTVGPLLCAVGVGLLSQLPRHASYPVDVLLPMVLFGLGLSATVAPLTATVLAAAPDEHAGLASGVNNAVARVGGLLAVAVLPLIAGLHGEGYARADLLVGPYRTAMVWCTALLVLGGLLSWAFVHDGVRASEDRSCPLNAPPLQDCPTGARPPDTPQPAST